MGLFNWILGKKTSPQRAPSEPSVEWPADLPPVEEYVDRIYRQQMLHAAAMVPGRLSAHQRLKKRRLQERTFFLF